MTTTQQPPARAEAGPRPEWATRPTTPEGWIERARQVGQILAADDAERDAANKTPYSEITLIKESGLAGLLLPAEHGGGGLEWPTAYKVIKEVSFGDGSIGHLLGYHYMWNWVPAAIGTPEQTARLEAESARGNWIMAGAVNARDKDVVVRDEGDHLVFNGKKTFSTGVKVSDRTVIEGVLEGTDTHVVAIVPTDQPGLVKLDNWDNMGQRLTESGGVNLNDIRVPWSDALGFVDKKFQPRPYGTMNVPTGQVIFASFWLGIAKRALHEASEYTRTKGTAWGGYERTVDEPRVLDIIGDLTAKLWAVEALVDQVAEEGLPLHRDPYGVTERMRGEYKIRTAAVKIAADSVVLEITNRMFEVTGARSTASKYGYDRFWRNVRTHTVHDPVPYQRQEIGAFQLRDEVPTPGWYS
ncbi:acyl-CoA dehydrogenase family protein [Kibdelosporangium persicum]|uniref:Dibenzothiophene desulfurization enzyme C n=1 Tax=Kibdelosporangium persicum TaxID=2698649 RepID=A0ABX2F6S6_9PSEU|nr:acyl-CoA dehydrogenase family protein [Kibdelosporangium persicum]NRN67056.1 Dibenzothiophene desulfurization enzyme C [Kibdelosporangium persicum]